MLNDGAMPAAVAAAIGAFGDEIEPGSVELWLDTDDDIDFFEYKHNDDVVWTTLDDSFDVNNLPYGTHDIYLRATDMAGNISEEIHLNLTLAPSVAVTVSRLPSWWTTVSRTVSPGVCAAMASRS